LDLIENIFNHLFKSSDYFNAVLPHLEDKYFLDSKTKTTFRKINEYNQKYGTQPNIADIALLIDTDNSVSEGDTEEIKSFLNSLKHLDKLSNEEMLVKETEKWAQNRALENAILESVEILQNPKASRGSIEQTIKKALGVEFNVQIGMDFFKDGPKRYESYIAEEEIIPTDIDMLNELLNGGFRKKSIHCFLGRVNIGKSLILCHIAASMLRLGRDVIYISAEMSEDMISKRIDANLMDIPMNDFNSQLDKKVYLSKLKSIFEKTQGRLIVKEYPTGAATANHIKNLLNEIKLKKGYVPSVIVLDYLNIFGSSRMGAAGMANSYQYIKSIAEELRAIAVEFDCCIITASQVNRTNANNNSPDMTATSSSNDHGLDVCNSPTT
jgi:replicative DNA helicase